MGENTQKNVDGKFANVTDVLQDYVTKSVGYLCSLWRKFPPANWQYHHPFVWCWNNLLLTLLLY